MPHKIEEKAKKLVLEKLKKSGLNVEYSDKKTFDLLVSGKYAEVKAKSKNYKKLDFISLTDKQFQAMKSQDFDIYLVCGIEENNPEIYRFNSRSLSEKRFRKVVSYEYDKSTIDTINKIKL